MTVVERPERCWKPTAIVPFGRRVLERGRGKGKSPKFTLDLDNKRVKAQPSIPQ